MAKPKQATHATSHSATATATTTIGRRGSSNRIRIHNDKVKSFGSQVYRGEEEGERRTVEP